jgi:hypothetical protein
MYAMYNLSLYTCEQLHNAGRGEQFKKEAQKALAYRRKLQCARKSRHQKAQEKRPVCATRWLCVFNIYVREQCACPVCAWVR